MRICFFGAYNPAYPRNAVIRRGLRLNGNDISECRVWPGRKFWLRYPLLLASWLKKGRRADFIFIPEFCQKDLPLARCLSLLTSKKLIFDPLASRYETKILDWKRKPPGTVQASWNRALDRWALRFSDLVLADTQAHKDYYCQSYGVPGAKVAVLPLGYDDEVFRKISREEDSSVFLVLFFGSFLPLHGADVIVEAAAAVARHDLSIRFKLIGSGQTFPRVKSLADNAGLTNVLFEGWISQERLAQEIGAAAISLGIFGRTEKARRVVPHKIFQSMGMGKPVITCRTPAAEEFFVHKKHIYYCDAPDPELLVRAILDLKKDESLRQKIARGGYALVRERHSPLAVGRMLNDILNGTFAFPR